MFLQWELIAIGPASCICDFKIRCGEVLALLREVISFLVNIDKMSHLTTLPWERTFGPLLKPKAFIRSVISVKQKQKKHVKIHNFNPQKMWKLSPYKYTMTVGGAMSDDHYTRVTAQGVQPILFSQIVSYPWRPSQKDLTSVNRRFPWCKPYSYVTECPIARVKTNPLWSQTIKTF